MLTVYQRDIGTAFAMHTFTLFHPPTTFAKICSLMYMAMMYMANLYVSGLCDKYTTLYYEVGRENLEL